MENSTVSDFDFRIHIFLSFLIITRFSINFTEDFKSPVRKEVKVSHETHLRRELEQWKELMKERGIRRSVTPK